MQGGAQKRVGRKRGEVEEHRGKGRKGRIEILGTVVLAHLHYPRSGPKGIRVYNGRTVLGLDQLAYRLRDPKGRKGPKGDPPIDSLSAYESSLRCRQSLLYRWHGYTRVFCEIALHIRVGETGVGCLKG